MAQVVWFDAGPDRAGRLLIVLHHLVVDGVSWRIIEGDLAAAWQAVTAGEPVRLQPTGTSFKRWAEHLVVAAHDPARVAELATWQAALEAPEVLLGDRPLDRTQDVMSTIRHVRQELSTQLTSAVLTQAPAAFRAGVNDVLLTALALAVADWRRRRGDGEGHAVLVDLESHGREEFADGIDLSRTVGWFTTVYPVRLDVGELDWPHVWTGGAPAAEALRRVKDQLGALADSGLGYGLLRHLNPTTRPALAGALPPQVGFNYLGRFSSDNTAGERPDWAVAPEPSDGPMDPDTPLAHCLEVNAFTEDGPDGQRLVAAWSWPAAIFAEADVRDLSETWQRALAALAAYRGAAAVDADLVSLSTADLADLDSGTDDSDDETDAMDEWESWS
jgi:non-ribosomal peptide synthase protein (TIGR01720 family)